MKILADCVIQEHWTGAGGGTGESYNIYDRATRRWHQTWVSSTGALLHLVGGMVGDSMVLANETGPDSARTLNRITWGPVADGRVRQRWDVSRDGGRTWQTVFDGYYRRRG